MLAKRPSIFEEQTARKPDYYPWAKKFIEAIQDGFWTHRLFTFSSDVQDFKVKLTEQERGVVTRALSMIAQVELPVKKFWANLGNNLPHPSLIDMGFVFAANEVVHSDAYDKLLDRLGLTHVYEDLSNLDIIADRITYLRRYAVKFSEDKRKQFVYSIVLFTLFIENLSLFSQFYTVNWFGKFKNVLKDTVSQVSYSFREEDLHQLGGVKIINAIKEEFPDIFDEELENRIREECILGLQYETRVIDWILGDFEHEFLNKNVLNEFIKNRLNKALNGIGYGEPFSVDTELLRKTHWFDELLIGGSFNDFFHAKPTDYGIANHSFNEEELFDVAI